MAFPSHPSTSIEVLVPGQNPNLDIVAIHGLNIFNEDSYERSAWTSGNKLWLRDFLPNKLPRARILLCKYNSRITMKDPSTDFEGQADGLLSLLKTMRENDTSRPIIFIAHGLGGLLAKLITNRAGREGEMYSAILKPIYGFVFFGTPHTGADYKALVGTAPDTTRSIFSKSPSIHLKVLKKHSLYSRVLNLGFRLSARVMGWKVLSFYEAVSYQNLGLIVNRDSATLGLSGGREKQIPIDANHERMCKFDNADVTVYKVFVEKGIVEFAKDATGDSGDLMSSMRNVLAGFQDISDTISRLNTPDAPPTYSDPPPPYSRKP